METANGLSVDEKGVVEAKRMEDGETVELAWGKVNDPAAEEYQNSLGIEDASWVENGSDDHGTYFIYERQGTQFKIYQSALNDAMG